LTYQFETAHNTVTVHTKRVRTHLLSCWFLISGSAYMYLCAKNYESCLQ